MKKSYRNKKNIMFKGVKKNKKYCKFNRLNLQEQEVILFQNIKNSIK